MAHSRIDQEKDALQHGDRHVHGHGSNHDGLAALVVDDPLAQAAGQVEQPLEFVDEFTDPALQGGGVERS